MYKYGFNILLFKILLITLLVISEVTAQKVQKPIDSSNNKNAVLDISNGGQVERESIVLAGEDINKKIKDNIFIKVETSKKECFVGEPLLVQYKLCTRLHSNSKVLSPPTFSGCSVIEMTSSEVKVAEEKINGKFFKTYIIRKVQLFPIQEGRLALGIATVDNEIKFIEQHTSSNISINKKALIINDSTFIKVKPLPIDTSKLGFSGAVGKFFMIGKVNKTNDTANNNNQLEITISGNGNFMSIPCPHIAWPSNIQPFESRSTELLDKLSFPILGEKKFLIPFICQKEGEVIIPSIVLRYFDPDTKQFTNAEIDSIHIKVAPPVHINIDALLKEEEKTEDEVTLIFIVSSIVLVITMILFIVLWKAKKKKSLRQYEKFIKSENALLKENIIAEDKIREFEIDEVSLPQVDFNKKLVLLSELADEKIFFRDAIDLCESIISSNSCIYEEEELNKIIALCNEALYSSVNTNSYLIFLRIEKVLN